MQELAVAKSDVARIDGLKKQLLDIEELLTLEADNHPSLEEDLAGELEGAENEIQKLEFELSFSGTYDRPLCSSLSACRCWRNGIPGLGGDADAYVSALGGKKRI
jgi:hypothetical protein